MPTSTPGALELPSQATLRDIPKRAFAFLNALGSSPAIRLTMSVHGYTQADHQEGWNILLKASDATGPMRIESATVKAMRELDAWDELGFHKAHAALVRRFPEQAAFVFNDLVPTQGPSAVIGVVKFLDRLDALENGASRTSTNTEDKKALDLLALRGFNVAERTRLRQLIAVAQSEPMTALDAQTAQQQATLQAESLTALYGWYSEWTEIARAVVSRRSDLILLGIAKRRTLDHGSNDVTGPVPTPTPAAPAPSP